MTRYRDRLESGHYQLGTITTTTLEPAAAEPAEASTTEVTEDTDEIRPDLDTMTKDELLAHAQNIGASPANKNMTKDELRASIDATS